MPKIEVKTDLKLELVTYSTKVVVKRQYVKFKRYKALGLSETISIEPRFTFTRRLYGI